MPVSKSVISRQILRLSALANPPQMDEGWRELEETLKREAISDEHAIRVVSQWIEQNRWCPSPKDLREMAEAAPARDFSKPDRDCNACGGTGWEHVWKLTTYESGDGYNHKTVEILSNNQAAELRGKVDGKSQIIYSNVRRCTVCRYGRDLAKISQERAKQPEAKAAAANGFSKVPRNFLERDDEE